MLLARQIVLISLLLVMISSMIAALERFSNWLITVLESVAVEADLLCMEDFGWANQATYEGASYLMCVAGNSDEEPNRPNYDIWHFMLEQHRAFKEKIFSKNKTTTYGPCSWVTARIRAKMGISR